MNRRPQHHGEKRLTTDQARVQLTMLLYNCRPKILDGLEVGELARMYRVPPREIEYLLTIARQKRAGEPR